MHLGLNKINVLNFLLMLLSTDAILARNSIEEGILQRPSRLASERNYKAASKEQQEIKVIYHHDGRCKCSCINDFMPLEMINSKQRVFIQGGVEPNDCRCPHIVVPRIGMLIAQNVTVIEKLCKACTCNYQQRNTLGQKIAVIFVLALIGTLIIYAAISLMIKKYFESKKCESFNESENRGLNDSGHFSADSEFIDLTPAENTEIDGNDVPSFSMSIHSKSNCRYRASTMSWLRKNFHSIIYNQRRWQLLVDEQWKNVNEKRILLN